MVSSVNESVSLLQVLLQKLSKLGQIKKKTLEKATDKIDKNDEFVSSNNAEEVSLKKSIANLLAMLFKDLFGDLKKEGAGSDFADLLKLLEGGLKDFSPEAFFSMLEDPGFRKYLEETLKQILELCEKKQKEGETPEIWKKAFDDFSIVQSLTGTTAISKLLKIAKDSKYPDQIKAMALAMVNDILNHLRLQSVDNKTAKTLVGMLGSSSDDIKEFLYSAIKDAKALDHETREVPNKYTPATFSPQNPLTATALYGSTRPNGGFLKKLTVA